MASFFSSIMLIPLNRYTLTLKYLLRHETQCLFMSNARTQATASYWITQAPDALLNISMLAYFQKYITHTLNQA